MNADRTGERGAALVMVLMLVVIFGALTTTMTQGNRQLTNDTVDERASLRALHAAEGGIEQARWRLQRDPHFAGEVLRIGNAEVTVTVTALQGTGSRWQARAVARCRPRGAGGHAVQRRVVADIVDGDSLPMVSEWRARP